MNLLQGHEATCPHCWETISLTLDLSVPEQSYIEDCPVCCKPMLISYSAVDGELDERSRRHERVAGSDTRQQGVHIQALLPEEHERPGGAG